MCCKKQGRKYYEMEDTRKNLIGHQIDRAIVLYLHHHLFRGNRKV